VRFLFVMAACPPSDNRVCAFRYRTFVGLYSYNFVGQDSDVGQRHLTKRNTLKNSVESKDYAHPK